MYFKKEHLSVVANAFLDKSIQTVKHAQKHSKNINENKRR